MQKMTAKRKYTAGVLYCCVAIFIMLVIQVPYSLTDSMLYDHTVYITANKSTPEAEDSPDCLTSNNSSVPCSNLTWVFRQDRRNSTNYVLLSGTHSLTISSIFRDLASLGFLGMGTAVIRCSGTESGLAFVNVVNVAFRDITFENCASLRNSTSRNYDYYKVNTDFELYDFYVALYFFQCSDVNMTSLTVRRSPNAVAVVMYNTVGNNVIRDSTFEMNRLNKSGFYPGGGGFYVEFTYCIPGDDNCDGFDDAIGNFNHDARYLFQNATFRRNLASNLQGYRGKETFIIPYKRIQNAFGKGGGMNIIFKGNASSNYFEFLDCVFEENEATLGGGLLVEYQDNSGNNTVLIKDSSFSRNRGKGAKTAGGGVRVGHYVTHTAENLPGNVFILDECELTHNRALFGGGVSVFLARQIIETDSQLLRVTVRDTTFEKNTASVGAAMECNIFSLFVRGELPSSVTISSTRFKNNKILERSKNARIHEEGVGVVYTNRIPIWFRNETVFEDNEGSALAIIGTAVDFSNSSTTFHSNTGKYGGAITILGSAFILVNDKTSMTFEKNTAKIHGGAIANVFIERANFEMYPNCFIRHVVPFVHPDQWGATFKFVDNSAGLLGQSIHTTSIRPCTWAGGSGKGNTSHILCWDGWSYFRNNSFSDCHSEINTESGKITYTNHDHDDGGGGDGDGDGGGGDGDDDGEFEDLYQFDANSSVRYITAIPGQEFILPLQIEDDLGRNITNQTVFTASTIQSDLSRVNSRYTYVSGEHVQLDGIGNNSITLLMHTDNVRTWQVLLDVELLDCPPGFEYSEGGEPSPSSQCRCSQHDYQGLLSCISDPMEARVINGYWFGVTSESGGNIVSSLCLPGFCRKDNHMGSLKLPLRKEELEEVMCGKENNRRGILCGECKDGYGPAVNKKDFRCVECKSPGLDILKYILSTYLPLFLLFIFIIAFRIRLTTGPVNAFIFYAQVVSSTFDLNADSHIRLEHLTYNETLLSIYRVPYGVFNLDFVESFVGSLCFGTSLNALNVLVLDYIIASFPLLMIIGVVIAVKIKDSSFFGRCSFRNSRHKFLRNWRMSESLLHGFSAFLLLSYTKFSLTSSYLVNIHSFLDSSGKEVGEKRVYYYGEYRSTDPEYLVYRIPAIFVLILITIPPLVLFGYPVIWFEKCIIRIPCIWQWYPADKVQIFLDTFQGCYKDNRRFFAGMYFAFRLTINATYIITENWLQQFVAQQVICTIFMFTIALLWPYRDEQWYVNYVDLFIFTNLAIVNSISLFLFVFAQINPHQSIPAWPFYVQYFLVFLPLIYMLLYLMWYFMKPSHKEKLKKLAKLPLKELRKRNRERFLRTTLMGRSNGARQTSPSSQRKITTAILNQDGIPTTELNIDSDESDGMVSSDSEDNLEAILVRAKTPNTYRSTNKSISQTQEQCTSEHCEVSRLITKDSGFGTHQLGSLVTSVKQGYDLNVSTSIALSDVGNNFKAAELTPRKKTKSSLVTPYGSLSA